MKRILTTCGLLVLLIGVAAPSARADDDGDAAAPLAVVMTNDVSANALKVYDAQTHALVQTVSTHGHGGVAGNARGVKAYGRLVAAVNFGSGTVAVFHRLGDHLRFDRTVTTTSAPVSVDFANGHMYVAGTTTVDSFVLGRHGVEWMDGSTTLAIAEGGTPPAGSTAQVGVVNADRLLVTLKTDPTPGTVDVVALKNGAVKAAPPQAIAA